MNSTLVLGSTTQHCGFLSLSKTKSNTTTRTVFFLCGIKSLADRYNNHAKENTIMLGGANIKVEHNTTMSSPKTEEEILNDISRLESDWNGNGAKEFSTETIEHARFLLDKLEKTPEIFPTGRDSINMQYELKDRSYLEFEVYNNKIECLRVPKRDYAKAYTETISRNNIERVNEIIKGFYSNND